MKISYIHGVCVKNDAISNSVKDEITWLSCGDQNSVRLYAYACDYEDLPFTKVKELKDIIYDQHFQSSDLVVFHFGVHYPLFDLLSVTPKRAKRIVVFHNITPKEFVSIETYPTIDKSFQQMANIRFADYVICDSQTNLDVLRAAGIHTPATVLSLAVHHQAKAPQTKPSIVDGITRIVFIGRFVKSKGPNELLEAINILLLRDPSLRLRVDMIGNLNFSNSALVEELRVSIAATHQMHGTRCHLIIHGNANEELKNKILRDADMFVLPSYHEGFCVPILEALSQACKVITYNNSNLPAISGGLGNLIPTGDVDALAKCILKSSREVKTAAWRGEKVGSFEEYKNKAIEYVRIYSTENTKRRFLKFIKNLVL